MKPKGEGVAVEGGYRCVCERCAEPFVARYSTAKTCSAVCRTVMWQQANPEQTLELQRKGGLAYYHRNIAAQRAANAEYKRRERKRCTEREQLRQAMMKPGHPQFVERVDRDVVYERHGGVCGICGCAVPSDEFEVDHRVPLSRGGLHGYDNCQPAHPRCNQSKHTKLEEEIVST